VPQNATLAQRRAPRIAIVGAGAGGLAAAVELAASGADVQLFERHDYPGGKMREVRTAGLGLDAGPTVFTMRWVFEELFARLDRRLEDCVPLTQADRLARHSWPDGSRLDLYPELDRSADAVAAFAGAREADAYRRFARDAGRIFDTLDDSFMRRERPGPLALTTRLGLRRLPELWRTRPFISLWSQLGRYFQDPRLRQLFARYATYCGSSPFSAPATLMLVAHAERRGVWLIEGGMRRLAAELAELARSAGARLEFSCGVAELLVENSRVNGIRLDNGEQVAADAVVFNGDTEALRQGLLGNAARRAVPARIPANSLSAVTWCLPARQVAFPLAYHTVFFGDDYADEFRALFRQGTVTTTPTVYVCAQDRGGTKEAEGEGSERLFCLVNAPARALTAAELDAIEERTRDNLARQGLVLELDHGDTVRTGPEEFAALFPGSAGALYGRPTHGWSGSFQRPGARARLTGLYLAGGSVHPGPGVPMATLSGRIAGQAVCRDLGLSSAGG